MIHRIFALLSLAASAAAQPSRIVTLKFMVSACPPRLCIAVAVHTTRRLTQHNALDIAHRKTTGTTS